MDSRVRSALARFFSDAGEAMSTPAGVNVDLLRSYCQPHNDGSPCFSGLRAGHTRH
jgi:hypothetical protein